MNSPDLFNKDKASSFILIVDDTPANIAILRAILEKEGYQVAVATSGEQALKIAPHIKPSVILLDVMMPEMNGFETCKRLEESPDTHDIPVIFITAKGEVEDIVEGFNSGGVDYITKPFQRKEVCVRVRTQFNIHALMEREKSQTERIKSILYAVTDGVIAMDQNAVITFINPAGESILGLSSGAATGSSLIDIAGLKGKPEALLLSEESPQELSLTTSRGQPRTLELTITKLNTIPMQYIGVLHDITLRKDKELELIKISQTDPLTGLANRRYFDERFEYEWQRCARQKEHLAVIMVDIDHFKQYNDTYGHLQGDECLTQVAHAISSASRRATEIVARFGGEEFVVIQAQSDLQQAQKIAAYLIEKVASLSILHESSETGIVTISAGAALTIPDSLMSPCALIEKADEALYDAKSKGRNQYCLKSE